MMRMTRRDRNWNHSKAKEWSCQLYITNIYPTLFPRTNLDVPELPREPEVTTENWVLSTYCLVIQAFANFLCFLNAST